MTGPEIRTPLPGPKAQAVIERDRQVVSSSYTRDYPFVMARGEGALVEDVDGNVFLDCTAGIAVAATGHLVGAPAHDERVELRDQAREVDIRIHHDPVVATILVGDEAVEAHGDLISEAAAGHGR